MNEIDLDEIHIICSLPSIDILKFLWSEGPTDTHSIAKGTHMSMAETYHHLQSLETQKLVKMKKNKIKNELKRIWNTTRDEFTISIKAEKGEIHYTSNIKQKSLKILDTITETKSKSKLEKENDLQLGTKIKVKTKDGEIELEGSEKIC